MSSPCVCCLTPPVAGYTATGGTAIAAPLSRRCGWPAARGKREHAVRGSPANAPETLGRWRTSFIIKHAHRSRSSPRCKRATDSFWIRYFLAWSVCGPQAYRLRGEKGGDMQRLTFHVEGAVVVLPFQLLQVESDVFGSYAVVFAQTFPCP